MVELKNFITQYAAKFISFDVLEKFHKHEKEFLIYKPKKEVLNNPIDLVGFLGSLPEELLSLHDIQKLRAPLTQIFVKTETASDAELFSSICKSKCWNLAAFLVQSSGNASGFYDDEKTKLLITQYIRAKNEESSKGKIPYHDEDYVEDNQTPCWSFEKLLYFASYLKEWELMKLIASIVPNPIFYVRPNEVLRTVLHVMVCYDSYDLIDWFLIDKKVSVSDEQYQELFFIAVQQGYVDLIRLLGGRLVTYKPKSNNVKDSLIHIAAVSENPQVLMAVIEVMVRNNVMCEAFFEEKGSRYEVKIVDILKDEIGISISDLVANDYLAYSEELAKQEYSHEKENEEFNILAVLNKEFKLKIRDIIKTDEYEKLQKIVIEGRGRVQIVDEVNLAELCMCRGTFQVRQDGVKKETKILLKDLIYKEAKIQIIVENKKILQLDELLNHYAVASINEMKSPLICAAESGQFINMLLLGYYGARFTFSSAKGQISLLDYAIEYYNYILKKDSVQKELLSALKTINFLIFYASIFNFTSSNYEELDKIFFFNKFTKRYEKNADVVDANYQQLLLQDFMGIIKQCKDNETILFDPRNKNRRKPKPNEILSEDQQLLPDYFELLKLKEQLQKDDSLLSHLLASTLTFSAKHLHGHHLGKDKKAIKSFVLAIDQAINSSEQGSEETAVDNASNKAKGWKTKLQFRNRDLNKSKKSGGEVEAKVEEIVLPGGPSSVNS